MRAEWVDTEMVNVVSSDTPEEGETVRAGAKEEEEEEDDQDDDGDDEEDENCEVVE